MSKMGSPASSNASLRDNVLVNERAKDLEEATKNGPLRMFPEDQWESVLLGPGIDGPNGQHTLIGFSQESVDIARKTLSWHAFPAEDRPPESFFVHGDGLVLVPRVPTHQPQQVRNPFSNTSNLPMPPPAPFLPQGLVPSRSSTSLPGSQNSTPLSTNNSQPNNSHLHTAPQQGHHHGSHSQGGHSHPPQPHYYTQSQGAPPGHAKTMQHLNTSLPPQVPDRSTQPQSRYSSTANALHATATTGGHGHSHSASSPYAKTTSSAPHTVVQARPANAKAGAHGTKKPGEYSDKKAATRDIGISGAAAASGSSLNATDPGAPQRCPDEIAGYCRSWNIMHQEVCLYSHHYLSEGNDAYDRSKLTSKYSFKRLVPGSPEFDYIKIRFINSWIHASSKKPTVTKIKQVSCPLLERLFNQRAETIQASGTKPNITELYHGTCEANFDTLFTQGFQPPADYAPHPQCPVSGHLADKLPTSLCKRTCRLCTSMPRHKWNVCHMWGLGIYCAIDSSKSDIYVSNKKGKKSDRIKRKMLLCSVILGEAENVKSLKTPHQMHDISSPAPGKHSIFAVGFKNATIPTLNGNTLGVVNDEYVVFHPHQIMPLYVIEYSKT